MLACHAGGPGSIPGRCSHFLAPLKKKIHDFGRILYEFFLPPHLNVIFERAQLAHYCRDIYFSNADREYICPPLTENEKNNIRQIISIHETSCRGISSDGRALA